MNRLFRVFLTFNATSLLVIVYLVQNTCTVSSFFPNCVWLNQLPNFISYVLYFIIPVIFTGISIKLSAFLGKDEFRKGDIVNIEHANNSFLPSYLGYFFVALSIRNWESLLFVYIILFTFTFKSQALYFNPLFLLFGYEFYNIRTKNGTTIFLISRKNYRNPDEVQITAANRVNNYTFIERGF